MLQITRCNKPGLCVDCKDNECHHAGDIGADCPKWKCDNDKPQDCTHCNFIKSYVKDFRTKQSQLTTTSQ